MLVSRKGYIRIRLNKKKSQFFFNLTQVMRTLASRKRFTNLTIRTRNLTTTTTNLYSLIWPLEEKDKDLQQ